MPGGAGGAGRELGADYFDAIYRRHVDPWNYAASDYELAKYADTLGMLPPRRWHRALEVGCSIGVLTAQLAARCERLVAVDVSEVALDRARERCAGLAGVELRRLRIADEFPEGCFDLVLLSEVGYYWTRDELDRAAPRLVESLALPGWLLLVHWTGVAADHPLSADEVHDRFAQLEGLRHAHGGRREGYRLDLYERAR